MKLKNETAKLTKSQAGRRRFGAAVMAMACAAGMMGSAQAAEFNKD